MSNMQWLWLDANVFNYENDLFFSTLKLYGIKMKRFSDYDSFARELAEIQPQGGLGHESLGIICSSSLCDGAYSNLANLGPAHEVYVYCMN